MKTSLLIVATAAALSAGCTSTPPIADNGERQQLVDATGQVIGYEQRIDGRTILFDSAGRPMGERWQDLRNEGTNPRNRGIPVVVDGGPAK